MPMTTTPRHRRRTAMFSIKMVPRRKRLLREAARRERVPMAAIVRRALDAELEEEDDAARE